MLNFLYHTILYYFKSLVQMHALLVIIHLNTKKKENISKTIYNLVTANKCCHSLLELYFMALFVMLGIKICRLLPLVEILKACLGTFPFQFSKFQLTQFPKTSKTFQALDAKTLCTILQKCTSKIYQKKIQL